jgi:hypothetical protein
VGSRQLESQLHVGFHFLLKSLKQREGELVACLGVNSELEEVLLQQMQIITAQKQEGSQLQEQLALAEQELKLLAERCRHLEEELAVAVQSFEHWRKEEVSSKDYYVNPFFDKNKLEEKYMSEIIQLESDLYLEKGQVRTLVDLVVEQTRLAHSAFFDLGANRYFVSRYDRDLWQRVRGLRSFDGVSWDEVLSLKEESEETECTRTQIMQKSMISTFSSLELEGMPMLVEESFEGLEENS